MPQISRENIEGSTLVVWRITETEEQLLAFVSQEDRQSAARFSNPRRRREHLAWRASLRAIIPQARVSYDPVTGAPSIGADRFISVSHTEGLAVVMISACPCAVDVERADRDFSRALSKFISAREQALAAGLSAEQRSLFPAYVWCGKEVAYKFSGRKELDLLEDIRVTALSPDSSQLTVEVRGVGEVTVGLEFREGYILAYTLCLQVGPK